jgi:hypothetical protein
VHLFGNSETWSLATHPMNESTNSRHTVNLEDANGVVPISRVLYPKNDTLPLTAAR